MADVTPFPAIVRRAEKPREALAAFLVQELEHSGFTVQWINEHSTICLRFDDNGPYAECDAPHIHVRVEDLA